MKNKKIALLLAMSLFLLCGACVKGSTDTGGITETYRYINESGVEVALVGERQGSFVIPDSLVLQTGESFECSSGFGRGEDMSQSFPYSGGDYDTFPITYFPLKIYFDKTARLVYYANKPKSRNPFFTNISYKTTKREEKNTNIYTYTYTFTAKDYQNALKAKQ